MHTHYFEGSYLKLDPEVERDSYLIQALDSLKSALPEEAGKLRLRINRLIGGVSPSALGLA